MRHIKLISSCIALCVTAIALFGCSDDNKDGGTPPKELRPGSYNAARHVGLGISLTAGFMNGSLYADAQQGGQKHSYDYLLAKAVHGASTDDLFKVPAFGNPGLGGALFDTTAPNNVRLVSNRVELTGVSGAGTPITRTNLSTANLNPDGLTTLNRPYNNLGIPGSLAADILSDNPFGFGAGRQSPFYQFIFRNQALGSNGVQQAINLMRAQPDSLPKLVTVWTGANEVLGFITSGGVTPIYPFNAFQAQYDTILARLKAGIPNVKIIVFNIPNVASIPFATYLGPNARAVTTQRGLSHLFYAKGSTIDSVATGDIGDVTKFMVLLPGGAGVAVIGDNTDGVKGVLWRTLLAPSTTRAPFKVRHRLTCNNLPQTSQVVQASIPPSPLAHAKIPSPTNSRSIKPKSPKPMPLSINTMPSSTQRTAKPMAFLLSISPVSSIELSHKALPRPTAKNCARRS